MEEITAVGPVDHSQRGTYWIVHLALESDVTLHEKSGSSIE